MDGRTGDLDTDQATGSTGDADAPGSPGDGVQQTAAPAVARDPVAPSSGLDPELAAGSRQAGRRPLVFVLVLTGAVMAFAIIVAIWMYWLAPALAV
jgi:hypothetical protein